MTLATAKLLVGRKIVGFELNGHRDEMISGLKLGMIYAPVFILDNGARVTFTAQEIDSSDGYGVKPNYHPKAKP